MAVLSLIVKSLLRERGLFGLWIASLCIAVSGLLIVDVYRNSLSRTLKFQGQKILTADLSISSRRPLTADEKQALNQALPPDTRYSTLTEMFAMVSHGEKGTARSRLASLRFIDDAYPLAGDLLIEAGDKITAGTGTQLSDRPLAWVAPDLLALMQLKAGDELMIGQTKFLIAGVIRKDSSQTFRFGSMAPRVFAHRKFLNGTALVQFGSTYSEDLFALLRNPPADLKEQAEKIFSDPAVQITIPTDLERGSFRVLSRLLDFLGLTGLVTLCLGWTGVYYLGRRWLSLEASTAGVLKCLGFSERDLQYYLLAKLSLIMLAGIISGGILAWLGAQILFPLVKESLPAEFILAWSWPNTLLLALVGPLAGLSLMWPAVRALSKEQPLALIQGLSAFRTSWRDLVAFSVTTALVFFFVTLAQARSWKVTFIFLGSLLGTSAAIAGLGYLLVLFSQRWQSTSSGWRIHLMLSQWTRRRSLAVLMITVSAMAGLLSQLVPTVEKTLVGELQAPQNGERPALFLFDIQEEQRDKLKEYMAKQGIAVSQTAPFIRARILKVNGGEFERTQTGGWATREADMDARMRNRGINLSYREQLAPLEKIIAGKPWDKMNHSLEAAEVSVEEGYANRLGLKVSDTLLFDVQGIEVNATVASLRRVDWNSFEPNFFIMFPAGVLDDAPKTWIMTIKPSTLHTPVAMQAIISGEFPNVSSVNVQEALDNAAELFAKLGGGLRLASGLCMALGLFVFLMILLFQLASSQKDWLQLFILGLREREYLGLQVMTYGGLCLVGASLGTVMSLAVAALLAHFAFAAPLAVEWITMAEIFALSLGSATAGMLLMASSRSRKSSLSQLIAD